MPQPRLDITRPLDDFPDSALRFRASKRRPNGSYPPLAVVTGRDAIDDGMSPGVWFPVGHGVWTKQLPWSQRHKD